MFPVLVQKAAGGLLGLVLAMLMESVLLIIRTSDRGRKAGMSRKPGGGARTSLPHTGQLGGSQTPGSSSDVKKTN